jgi:hypothetical protein
MPAENTFFAAQRSISFARESLRVMQHTSANPESFAYQILTDTDMSTAAFQTIPKRKLGNSNLEVSAMAWGAWA